MNREHPVRHRLRTARTVGFGGALALLTAGIGCASGGDKAAAPVPVLTTLVVTLGSATIQIGQSTQASVAGLDQNNASVAIEAVTWSTDAPLIATVDAAGLVHGVAPGPVLIRASVSGRNGLALLTVALPPSLLRYDIDANVTPDQSDLVRSGIDFGRSYLSVMAGGDIPSDQRSQLTVRVVATGTGNPASPSGAGCTGLDENGIARPFIDVLHPCWNQSPSIGPENHRLSVAAHEYTHAWQNQTGCLGRVLLTAPRSTSIEAWIREGSASFVGYRGLFRERLNIDSTRKRELRSAISNGTISESLRTLEYLGGVPTLLSPYEMGYLAIEYLTDRSPGGVRSLRTHCEAVARGIPLDEAFLLAFGTSKGDFYAAFSDYLYELRMRYKL